MNKLLLSIGKIAENSKRIPIKGKKRNARSR